MGNKQISIEEKIKSVFVKMIVILVISVLGNMISSYMLLIRYDKLITNVEYANKLKDFVEEDIYSETWNIVSGLTSFEEGKQYEIIQDIYEGIEYLVANTTLESESTQLEVAKRTTNTLETYLDKLGEALDKASRVDVSMEIYDEIRNVSMLVGDLLQEFIYFEIQNAARLNSIMVTTQNIILMINAFLILGFIWMMLRTKKTLIWSIKKPINKLESMALKIAEGEFDAKVDHVELQELKSLATSLNTMASKIKELIAENNQEHENLKKAELSLLQAQIKPHFLYNTYDTIIWLAEKNSMEEVIRVVEALTVYYRVTLSKGDEWISVNNEINHVESYLVIQHFRYGNILDYSIEVDDSIKKIKMLKLLLQPIVENAIYHGVKYLRSKGFISIKGYREEQHIYFTITDTGIGMDSDRLSQLQRHIHSDLLDNQETDGGKFGFGLRNVYQRIRLYYGDGSSMEIKSEEGVGTTITIKLALNIIPLRGGMRHV